MTEYTSVAGDGKNHLKKAMEFMLWRGGPKITEVVGSDYLFSNQAPSIEIMGGSISGQGTQACVWYWDGAQYVRMLDAAVNATNCKTGSCVRWCSYTNFPITYTP